MKRNKNPSGSSDEERTSLRQKRAKKESQGEGENVKVDTAETDEDRRVNRSVRNAQVNDHNTNVKDGMDSNSEEICDDNLSYYAHSRVKTDNDTLIHERNVLPSCSRSIHIASSVNEEESQRSSRRQSNQYRKEESNKSYISAEIGQEIRKGLKRKKLTSSAKNISNHHSESGDKRQREESSSYQSNEYREEESSKYRTNAKIRRKVVLSGSFLYNEIRTTDSSIDNTKNVNVRKFRRFFCCVISAYNYVVDGLEGCERKYCDCLKDQYTAEGNSSHIDVEMDQEISFTGLWCDEMRTASFIDNGGIFNDGSTIFCCPRSLCNYIGIEGWDTVPCDCLKCPDQNDNSEDGRNNKVNDEILISPETYYTNERILGSRIDSCETDYANNHPTHEFANAEDVNDRARVSYQYGEERNERGTNHFDGRISNVNNQNFAPQRISSPQSVYNHPKNIAYECGRPQHRNGESNRHLADSGNSQDVGESSHSREFSSVEVRQTESDEDQEITNDGQNYLILLFRDRAEDDAVSDTNVGNCETIEIECAEEVIGFESDDDGDQLEQFRDEINMDDDGHEGDDEQGDGEGDEEWVEGENEEWGEWRAENEGGDREHDNVEDDEGGNEGGGREHDNVEDEEYYDDDDDDWWFLSSESNDDGYLTADIEYSSERD